MTTFQGIPAGAFGFYEELQDNNNRQWWQEHKAGYQSLVKQPLASLLAELEPRFGPAKLFRPNRDIRFSEDKSPYKTAQGAGASVQEGVGYYLQISADGLLVGGGCHSHTPAQLARYRNSVDASGTGEALRHIVEAVAAAGFSVEGETLKTVPRGYAGRTGWPPPARSGRSRRCGMACARWWTGSAGTLPLDGGFTC